MIFRFNSLWKKRIEKLETAHNQTLEEFDILKEKIIELSMHSHEPQNYKEKYDKLEKRIEALEKKVHMIR